MTTDEIKIWKPTKRQVDYCQAITRNGGTIDAREFTDEGELLVTWRHGDEGPWMVAVPRKGHV